MNAHESSITHRAQLESGLTVEWVRSTGEGDSDWSVVCYSDGSRWLYDNGSAEEITLMGTMIDGLGKAEILGTSNGAIIALYADGPQAFSDHNDWLESLAESDKIKASN